MLRAAGGGGFEPLPGEHLLALDGDQPCAGVGRAHAEFKLLAAVPFVFGELEFEFGVAFETALRVAFADDGEGAKRQDVVVLVPQFDAEVTGLVGGDREGFALFPHGEGRLLESLLAARGDIGVVPVLLLREHGEIPDLNNALRQLGQSDLLQVGTDGDELHVALRVLADVAEIAVRLEADDIGQGRHQQFFAGAHTSPTVGFEAFRHHHGLEAAALEPFQAEIELRLALRVGFLLAQLNGFTSTRFGFIAKAVVEAEVGVLLKGKLGGIEFELGRETTIRCGEIKQRLQGQRRFDIFRQHPTGRCRFVEGQIKLHAVRLEVLHAEAHEGDARSLTIRVGMKDMKIHGIAPSWIAFVGGDFEIKEPIGGQREPGAEVFLILGVVYDDLHGQALKFALPVALADDATEVDGVTGTIDPALTKE